jgi:GT2 family glycosyltransferase
LTPSYGCIVLTQNQRPDDLRRAVESLHAQKGVEMDIVVVGNGCEPQGVPDDARRLALAENLGVPGGRNAGVPQVQGELLLFLDDDARFDDDQALHGIARLFEADPQLAVVQPRLADPSGRPGPRSWVPRLWTNDPARSGDVTVMSEAALVVRRSAFEQVDGWPDHFFFYAENSDLAWRLLDAGYRIWYAGDIVALHPAPVARRRGRFRYFAARNRVWVARRRLPLPLAAAYVGGWMLRMAARSRSLDDAREVLQGARAGFREDAGERRPLRWRTIWRMTRAGRPPIL